MKTNNITATTTTADMIGLTALAVITFDSCESNLTNARDALNAQLLDMKKAGVPMAFSTYTAEGKLEKKAVMSCPTRKALKIALQEGGMRVERAESVVQFLSLYYATGIPVASLRKVEDVVAAIGLDRLQKLRAVKPDSKPFKPAESAGLTVAENANKEAAAAAQIKPINKGRMPKITPIWALWDTLQAHDDARVFNQWLQNGMQGPLQAYVEASKGDEVNKQKLATALAEVGRLTELVKAVGDGTPKPKRKAKVAA